MTKSTNPADFHWWQDGIIYQIYPRSFADSNGDGFGDLPGITAQLTYLAELGVDALWLSPIYPSPDADFGYDIADYTDIDPRFGSLKDFDQLVAQAHKLGLRIILDMVLNHSSDQHPWFLESRSGRTNPRRDWYIWRDPAAGGRPPNNWQTSFGGSAWEFDPTSGQYYLHSFLKQQPDVNWRNPAVRQAMLDVFRFWLDRGVDGFRLDVFNAFFKDEQFRDNPVSFGLRAFDRQKHIYDMNQPEMFGFLGELRALLDAYPERYSVGETYITSEKAITYVGNDRLHAAFSFDFFESELTFPWRPGWILERLTKRDNLFEAAKAWPTTVLGNHDKPRIASRYARGELDDQALIAMALLLTVRGTPYLYYGEEIGMRDIKLKRSEIMDPPGKKYWPIFKGRDGCRSPMQWNSSDYAGFSTAQPWLKVHPDYPKRNVAAQQADPASILNLTRRLIALRRITPALRRGTFKPIFRTDTGVLAYERELKQANGESERVLVYLNFSAAPRPVGLTADVKPDSLNILFDSAGRTELSFNNQQFELSPYEILLLEVKMATV